jgi:hypothetical protein
MRAVSIVLGLAAALSGASVAWSQDGPVAHVTGDDTADQIAQWLKTEDQGPTGPNGAQDSAAPPRQIHGEVGLTVSNRGYGGYVASALPIGQGSELDVAVGGAHERLHGGGSANARSLSVGLVLDASDVGRWLSHDTCGMQHTGVRLRDDPVATSDGLCQRPEPRTPPAGGGGGG